MSLPYVRAVISFCHGRDGRRDRPRHRLHRADDPRRTPNSGL